MYNVEYKTLDKLGRTKKTFHGGIFLTEEKLEEFKKEILSNTKEKISFEVYSLNESNIKLS